MKGIKREISVARTPQQNGVAERKNMTLIEAARTMLADSLLPTTFWAEAVKPPSISFMRPFGCPVTILNTLDPLGKFDGKADEGFLVGYFINSKAFKVFNTRTRKVEENLHITFLENKPNVAGSGPDWLFDIDLLTNSMNYEPVTTGNQTNGNAGIKDNVDAVPTQQYILLPLLSDSSQNSEDAVADDAGKKTTEEPTNKGERNGQEKEGGASNKEGDQNVQDLRTELDNLLVQQKEGYANSTNRVSIISPFDTTNFLNTGIFSGAYDDDDEGAKADLNKLETPMNVSPIPITRIHKDHPKDQIIGDINSATQTRRMTKIPEEHVMKAIQALADPSWVEAMQEELLKFRLQKVWTLVDLPNGKRAIGTKWVFRNRKDDRGIVVRNKDRRNQVILAYASLIGFIVYQMDVKSAFLYGTIEAEVKQRDDGVFISQDKYVADILKKFDFVIVKTASTPIETNKALLKDEEAEDVDVHLYRSMIGSLMYLTASRPDIMFAVCACARFYVTPKVSYLHAVKRIFRYLKGQPKLGLWYPRDSPFDLEAFFNSDYARARLDRKSITRGCQFLGKRLISCSKSTAWNEFSTNIALAVICLANNQKFNFSKLIFDEPFNDTYETPKHTQKVFTNIRRKGKSFSGTVTPLFQSMLAIQAGKGKGSGHPLNPTTLPAAPPFMKYKFTTVASHPKRLTPLWHPKEVGTLRFLSLVVPLRRLVIRATTTATRLEWLGLPLLLLGSGSRPRCPNTTLGDADAWTRFDTTSKQLTLHQDDLTDFVPPTPHDSPLSGGHAPGSDEGRPNINKLMAICIKLSNRVLALETSKTAQDLVIKKLKKKVKRLEKKQRARTPRMKLFKIVQNCLTASKVVVEEPNIGKEASSRRFRSRVAAELEDFL
ncbi:putative ribonuclease H-like domain-containing protein [Tanacetum coccineum]